MAKSLRDRILEALKKEASNPLDISRRLRLSQKYVTWQLSVLEEEGVIEYDMARGKWHLKRN